MYLDFLNAFFKEYAIQLLAKGFKLLVSLQGIAANPGIGASMSPSFKSLQHLWLATVPRYPPDHDLLLQFLLLRRRVEVGPVEPISAM